ncbi:MAG: 9-O-acetylesterase [Ferruginibacter sp.]|nr:9-O-acetylesterase [Cytophagales bacterium]
MNFRVRILTWALLGCLGAHSSPAAVRLPKLVGDHMVLQRDVPLPLWGWSDPGEKVTVTFRGQSYPAKPGADGKWTVTLPATPAGGPYEMTIRGKNTLVVRDILVGDVWLASGQSNMEWPLREANDFEREIANANHPRIRFLDVKNAVAFAPQTDFNSDGWRVCSPQTAGDFSAVAYFFGRDLQKQYDVPVGLISTEWGGTLAEAWTSSNALKALPEFGTKIAELAASQGDINRVQAEYNARMDAWQKSAASKDRGYLPDGKTWADPAFEAKGWTTMKVPGLWEETKEMSDFDGIVWFRKEITLSSEQAGKPLTLALSRIDDRDTTWFNGVRVGSTDGYNKPRTYAVPASLVKAGRNVITVRVLDTGGGGGFGGKPEEVYAEAGGQTVSLAGDWPYQTAFDTRHMPKSPFPGGSHNTPTALYNAMIAPLAPYAIKGAIWYQGESNANRAYQYRTLFPAMIRDWRSQWGYDFPFLFVQLANYQKDQDQPGDYDWAELREAQTMALSVPKTGMAVAIDIGNPDDIHPRNKQDVGKRLALVARKVAYGDNQVVYSGPLYESMTTEGNQVRLKFKNTGGGLALKDLSGAYLKGFAIAGADKKFVWAKGKLDGNTLVLRSDQVPAPVAVRYDWGNSPFPNLYNREGLPASPFRTDDWQGITYGKQ